MRDQLIAKLQTKKATIGIVGLGYVGLPLALRYAEVGFRVLGLDIDRGKVAALKRGESYIGHIRSDRVAACRKYLEATTDISRSAEADALILCVPTPLNKHREPDLSYIITTIESLVPYLRPGQIVSLESSTYPGTTDEELKPRIESRGLRVGHDVFLVFSPEREDPANAHYNIQTIPKVCGGVTSACLEVGKNLYGQVVDKVIPVSSTRVAEMTKLLENIYRAVNIGLANEMKIVADKMGIDIYEVIQAAATKPFGFVPYYPGPGLGGHCLPIDPFYLTWKAHEYGVHTRFIELAGEVNSTMPEWVVAKVAGALNQRRKPVRDSRILILGIAYKKNVDDLRGSPAVEILERLRVMGAQLDYADPHVPVFSGMAKSGPKLQSVEVTAESIKKYDAVVLVTNHDSFDYDLIKRHAALIVDTRGVYLEPAPHIVKA